jgi:hypothetical protein
MGRLMGKLAPKKPAGAPVSTPVKVKESGPYGAYRQVGLADTEWQVRDGYGIVIRRIVEVDMHTAKNFAQKYADELNEAFARGRASHTAWLPKVLKDAVAAEDAKWGHK